METIEIIPVEDDPQISLLTKTAKSLLRAVNAEAKRRIDFHQRNYNIFWNGPIKPGDILLEMGPKAGLFLTTSRSSVSDIFNLLAIIEPDEEKRNILAEKLFPKSNWYPRLELIAHEDGTVTLQPQEGLDDWGRPINPDAPLEVSRKETPKKKKKKSVN